MEIQTSRSNSDTSPRRSESHRNGTRTLDSKLREIFGDELLFEAFMAWMYREFSSEVLLSLIEFVQFKALLKGSQINEKENIVFYSEIPKSTIVHSTDGIPAIADALYEKYIRSHSELQINISSMLRHRWDLLHFTNYHERDRDKLISAVAEVLQEMLKYIRQSFLRFDIDRE